MIISRPPEVTSGCYNSYSVKSLALLSSHDFYCFISTYIYIYIFTTYIRAGLSSEHSQSEILLPEWLEGIGTKQQAIFDCCILYKSKLWIYIHNMWFTAWHTVLWWHKMCICFLPTIWWKDPYLYNIRGFQTLCVIAMGHSYGVLPWGSQWLRRCGFLHEW